MKLKGERSRRTLDSRYYECSDGCGHEYDGFVRQNNRLVAKCIDCEHAYESIYERYVEVNNFEASIFTRDMHDIWEKQLVDYIDSNLGTITTDEEAEIDAYIAFNQLTSSVMPDIIVTYTYRADGLRYSKTVDGVTTTHVWIGNNIVLERNASGAIINRFDRSLTGRLIRSDNHGYYLHNKRGDVVQRADAQGGVIRSYRYTAFGVELSSDEANCNPFRFASMYWDAETGTYYTPNRHFNPRTGRWTQPDPLFWGPANIFTSLTEAAKLYVFVMNNPIFWIDPSGLVAVNIKEFARTFDATATLKIKGPRGQEHAFFMITSGDTSFMISGNQMSLVNGAWVADDSHFINALGVGTDSYVLFQCQQQATFP